MTTKKRLVSGIQPTGKMHLGNYVGAVRNWVKLQDEYEAFFLIVDLHALTTQYAHPDQLRTDKLNLAIDLLASGIDPEKSALFFQSDVPEHCELHLILSMITPLPWLTRVPTYKSKIAELKEKDLNTYGFLGYPVLQAADILLYQADVVPVGLDQLPHIELTREIARRFNHFYTPMFTEPKEVLTQFPNIPGTDGKKMSKSANNTIPVGESPEVIEKLVMKMFTDPHRIRRQDPGSPDICPVYKIHQVFNTPEGQQAIHKGCSTAQIGCVDCKKECAERILESLKDFHQKRHELLKNLDYVRECLKKGTEKGQRVARETLAKVKTAVGL